MRTVRRVMVSILFAACCAVHAQEGAPASPLDRDITLVGRDDTVILVPPPSRFDAIALPALDMTPPDPVRVPAIQPPMGDHSGAWSYPSAQTVLRENPR